MTLTSYQVSVLYDKLKESDIKKIFYAFKRCTRKVTKKDDYTTAIQNLLNTYIMLIKYINQKLGQETPEFKTKTNDIKNLHIEELRNLHASYRQVLINRRHKRDMINAIVKLCDMLEKYIEI